MKNLSQLTAAALVSGLLILFFGSFVGCVSKPKVDWNRRLGSFSYDQAVVELGPPTASTRLDDGTIVADWFLKYGSQFSFGGGTGFYGGATGMGVGQSVTTAPSGHYLRLVFGPDGKLTKWEKIKK